MTINDVALEEGRVLILSSAGRSCRVLIIMYRVDLPRSAEEAGTKGRPWKEQD